MQNKASFTFGGIAVALGLIGAAFIARDGLLAFKRLGRTVSVRGLDERIVKSNQVVWSINFVVTGNDLTEVSGSIKRSQEVILSFLGESGIPRSAVQLTPPSVVDSQANSYQNRGSAPRFSARAAATATTPLVDVVTEKVNDTAELVTQGVVVESSNVGYNFTELNRIKPEMLKRASEEARKAADALARDIGAQIGDLVSVSQGLFSITSPITDDHYQAKQSLMKKVRVVTRASYEIGN